LQTENRWEKSNIGREEKKGKTLCRHDTNARLAYEGEGAHHVADLSKNQRALRGIELEKKGEKKRKNPIHPK